MLRWYPCPVLPQQLWLIPMSHCLPHLQNENDPSLDYANFALTHVSAVPQWYAYAQLIVCFPQFLKVRLLIYPDIVYIVKLMKPVSFWLMTSSVMAFLSSSMTSSVKSSVNDNYSTPSRQTRKLKPISCFARALLTDQSQLLRNVSRDAQPTGQSSTNAYA